MDDESAFMQLVLANAQGELKPLERGIHALAAIEKRKWGKSVAAYAERLERPEQSVRNEVWAAEVWEAEVAAAAQNPPLAVDLTNLIDRSSHLTEIHAAPEHCRSALVGRLIKEDWTKEQTRAAIRAVREARPPRGYERYFPAEQLQLRTAKGEDPTETVSLAVRAIERGRSDIREVGFAVDEHIALRGEPTWKD